MTIIPSINVFPSLLPYRPRGFAHPKSSASGRLVLVDERFSAAKLSVARSSSVATITTSTFASSGTAKRRTAVETQHFSRYYVTKHLLSSS